ELGYDGYPAMQKALQEIIRNKLTAVQRIEVANDRIGESNALDMVMRSDIDNILSTLNEIDRSEFDSVVNSILAARRIYIIGVRSASALAQFLGFYFRLIFPDVSVVGTISASEIFEQILGISEGDVFIGISFPRYSKRTLKAMQYAQSRGANVVALTDSERSPLNKFATNKLIAKSDMVSFVDSLVAPLSIINALIVAISMRKNAEISDTFKRLEKIWDEYEVYEKFDNE
ncbi:MAG: MurR/RpiR family transcriptional regulator, partial [Clostridia bacterium]